MECISCNEPLKPHWKLCPACGEHLVDTCPGCGGALQPGAHSCPACSRILKVDCGMCGAVLQAQWKACPECGTANDIPLLEDERFRCESCDQLLGPELRFEGSDICQACAIGPDLNPAPEEEPTEPTVPAIAVQPFEQGDALQDVLKDGSPGPEMVIVPAGKFRMGDLQGVGEPSERPVRIVEIQKRFAIGRYPVTFAEYDRYARETGAVLPEDGGWGRDRRPVIIVSWKCAQGYVVWLSEQTGKQYRLPSEAEWEYAARAGSETIYPWGNEIDVTQASYLGPGASGRTEPVGHYPANALGLHDMIGNVWEWVEDVWQETYADAPADGSPRLDGDESVRVLRGGSWYSYADKLRCASRNSFASTARNLSIGFRLARELETP